MANNIFDRNFVGTRVEQEKRGDNPATRCPFGCGNIARIRVVDNRRDTVHLCCIVCAKKFIELHSEGCGQLLADEIVRLTKRAPDEGAGWDCSSCGVTNYQLNVEICQNCLHPRG